MNVIALSILFLTDDKMPNDTPRIVFCGKDGWSVARSWQGGQITPVDAGDGTIAPDGSLFGLCRAVRRDLACASIPHMDDGFYHAYCNQAAARVLLGDDGFCRVAQQLKGRPPVTDPRQAFYPTALRAV